MGNSTNVDIEKEKFETDTYFLSPFFTFRDLFPSEFSLMDRDFVGESFPMFGAQRSVSEWKVFTKKSVTSLLEGVKKG